MSARRPTGRTYSPARLTIALLGVVLMAGGLLLPGAGPVAAADRVHAAVVGSGSTWSANALQAWIRNVWANYHWKLTYSESGSTQGRNDFANGTADFGVSEIPYAISNSNEADVRPARKFAYMPIVAGGTSFMYNLQIAGKRVTNLRLSGDTVGKIFTGVITSWDDPAIKADNPALALPAIPIVPVVRSDGSGATAQFSIWMRQEHPDLWDAYCGKVGRPLINGHCGVTSNYPVVAGSGFVSRAGSNGVAGYVAQSHAVGAITFVEYSYALNSSFPVAKLLNAAGYYTEPTAQNVAVALLQAQINEDESSVDYLTQNLSRVYTDGDPRTYPLSSYSYIILPTAIEANFTEDKGYTLADFGAYFLCEGQQSADVLGYSPLPINLVQAGQKQIQKIPGGDPVIKGITDCNNPTFSPDGTNRLANDAPMPPDCDRQGTSQCTTGTGGAKDTPTDNTGDKNNDGAGGNKNNSTNDPNNPSDPNAPGNNDGNNSGGPNANDDAANSGSNDPGRSNRPGAGDSSVIDLASEDAPMVASGSPQSIPQAVSGPVSQAAMLGAGAGLLGMAAVPPILGKRTRKRHVPAPPRGSPSQQS